MISPVGYQRSGAFNVSRNSGPFTGGRPLILSWTAFVALAAAAKPSSSFCSRSKARVIAISFGAQYVVQLFSDHQRFSRRPPAHATDLPNSRRWWGRCLAVAGALRERTPPIARRRIPDYQRQLVYAVGLRRGNAGRSICIPVSQAVRSAFRELREVCRRHAENIGAAARKGGNQLAPISAALPPLRGTARDYGVAARGHLQEYLRVQSFIKRLTLHLVAGCSSYIALSESIVRCHAAVWLAQVFFSANAGARQQARIVPRKASLPPSPPQRPQSAPRSGCHMPEPARLIAGGSGVRAVCQA